MSQGVESTGRAGTYRLSWQAQRGKNMRTVNFVLVIFPSLTVDKMMLNVTVILQGIKRNSELQSNTSITNFFGESSVSHGLKVISAEVMMAQFIALHNLPFQAADHLSDLVSSMFPDSLIAADFSSKHTKTKSIICDALDPFLKEPIIDSLKSTPFNLMCDESNDKGDQCKLLTILVSLFDANTDSIVTRHLETGYNRFYC